MPQNQTNILKIEKIEKIFKIKVSSFKSKNLYALNKVTLEVEKGKTVAVVGESGCGKTTLGKVISGLYQAEKGTIKFHGQDIAHKRPQQRGILQKDIQMIFQDPYSSLNPRKKVRDILEQPLKVHTKLDKVERLAAIEKTCTDVGIDLEYLSRYPHQFSGGQRQRIAIARAIILNPELVIADEPISALDVSIQAQVLNLMMDLQEKLSLTYLFITHDISVVKHLSDYVAVMYLGEIVEYGTKEQIFNNPQHPYTKMLFAAVPDIDNPMISEKVLETGEIPSPIDLPAGCYFAGRCPLKDVDCEKEHPPLQEKENQYKVRCIKVQSGS
ncbi:MAG: dipeptide ABC transporter ATP-binding protein [Thermodesulfobacteriota bacterium]|nr:dipeptide ABC transporter ATP-binding protein [Thermodesulfobacteriota bacterium]